MDIRGESGLNLWREWYILRRNAKDDIPSGDQHTTHYPALFINCVHQLYIPWPQFCINFPLIIPFFIYIHLDINKYIGYMYILNLRRLRGSWSFNLMSMLYLKSYKMNAVCGLYTHIRSSSNFELPITLRHTSFLVIKISLCILVLV